MRVLLVKLSSMGDLIHALPALTDATKAYPDIEFDWVVDEGFVEIPELHRSVRRTIKSAHRRWSKNKWQTLKSGELRTFWRELRSESYDIVLDAQNNMKSAIITRMSRGLRCGMDSKSVREYGAHFAYQKKFSIPPFTEIHAVTRQRMIFSKALDYPMPETAPDYGIDTSKLPMLDFELPKPYLMFIHNTTWESKHWPERYWAELIKIATNAGYNIVLPWGNDKEHERAQRLSKVSSQTMVVPYLDIKEKARVIYEAQGIIAVDTGLAHLTAVLDKPALHLYGPTDVNLLGVQNPTQKFIAAKYSCAPCYLHQCKFGNEAECFVKELPPEKVWDNFITHLNYR